MKKFIFGFLLVLLLSFSTVAGVNAQTMTPTPTETTLLTTPSITVLPTLVASGSATPTKITSLPKTGMIQYSAAFFVISIGVILFAFVF